MKLGCLWVNALVRDCENRWIFCSSINNKSQCWSGRGGVGVLAAGVGCGGDVSAADARPPPLLRHPLLQHLAPQLQDARGSLLLRGENGGEVVSQP